MEGDKNKQARRELYEMLKSDGYYNGNYSDFTANIDNKQGRQELYDMLSADGYYSGSKEDFSSMLTIQKPKQQSTQPKTAVGVTQEGAYTPKFDMQAYGNRTPEEAKAKSQQTYMPYATAPTVDDAKKREYERATKNGEITEAPYTTDAVKEYYDGYSDEEKTLHKYGMRPEDMEYRKQQDADASVLEADNQHKALNELRTRGYGEIAQLEKNINEMYDAQADAKKALYSKMYRENVSYNPMSMTGGQYAQDLNKVSDKEKYAFNQMNMLDAAKHKMDETREIIAAAERYKGNPNALARFAKDTWASFSNKVTDPNMWTFGVSELLDNASMYSLLEKADKGEKLTKNEEALMDAIVYNTAVNTYLANYQGIGNQVGTTTAEMIPFMIEMYLNPASGLGEAAGNAASKKVATYAAKKFLKKQITKATGKWIVRSGKWLPRMAADIGAGAIMSSTTGTARVEADTYRRMAGDVQVKLNDSDNGGKTFEYNGRVGQKGYDEAKKEAFINQTIQNQSEFVGEYFDPLTKWLGGRIMSGILKGTDKYGTQIVRDWVAGTLKLERKIQNNGMAKIFKDFNEKAKYNGAINEYIEEFVGNCELATVGVDMEWSTEKDKGVFNLEDNFATFLSVAVPGVAQSAITTAHVGATKAGVDARMYDADRYGKEVFGKTIGSGIWDIIKADIDEAIEGVDKTGSKDVFAEAARNLASVRKGLGTMTQEEKNAFMNYVSAKTAKTAFDAGMNMREEQEVDEFEEAVSALREKGYGIETHKDVHEASKVADKAEAELANVGIDERLKSVVDRMLADNDMQGLNNMLKNDLSEDEASAVMAYIDAKSVCDGVQQKVNEDIDNQVEEERYKIAPYVRDNGTFATIDIDGKNRYVKGISEDGKTYYYFDDEGKVKSANVDTDNVDINTYVEKNFEQYMAEYDDALANDAINDVNNKMAHHPNTVTDFTAEKQEFAIPVAVEGGWMEQRFQTVGYKEEAGEVSYLPMKYKADAIDNGDGTKSAGWVVDDSASPITRKVDDVVADQDSAWDGKGDADEIAATGTTTDTENVPAPTEAVPTEAAQAETGEEAEPTGETAQTDAETAVEEQPSTAAEAEEEVPEGKKRLGNGNIVDADKDGEPVFANEDVENAGQYIADIEAEAGKDIADVVLKAKIQNAHDKVAAIAKKEPTIDKFKGAYGKYKAAHDEWQAQHDDALAQRALWQGVNKARNEAADAKLTEVAKKAEEMRKAQEEARTNDELDRSLGESVNRDEWIARNIWGYKFIWNDKPNGTKGLASHLFGRGTDAKGELPNYLSIVNDATGLSPEEVAEQLSAQIPNEFGGVEEPVSLDEVLAVIQQYSNRGAALRAIAQARQEAADAMVRQQEAEAQRVAEEEARKKAENEGFEGLVPPAEADNAPAPDINGVFEEEGEAQPRTAETKEEPKAEESVLQEMLNKVQSTTNKKITVTEWNEDNLSGKVLVDGKSINVSLECFLPDSIFEKPIYSLAWLPSSIENDNNFYQIVEDIAEEYNKENKTNITMWSDTGLLYNNSVDNNSDVLIDFALFANRKVKEYLNSKNTDSVSKPVVEEPAEEQIDGVNVSDIRAVIDALPKDSSFDKIRANLQRQLKIGYNKAGKILNALGYEEKAEEPVKEQPKTVAEKPVEASLGNGTLVVGKPAVGTKKAEKKKGNGSIEGFIPNDEVQNHNWNQYKKGQEFTYNGYPYRFLFVDVNENGYVEGVVMEHLDADGNVTARENVPPLMFMENFKKSETKTAKPKVEAPKEEKKFLVSDDRRAELMNRLRGKLNNMNMGLDPELFAIGAELAFSDIERGAVKFYDYAKGMIANIGDSIRPYLKSFYNGVRDMPEAVDFVKDMDSYEFVSSVDIMTFDKEDKKNVDPIEKAKVVSAEKKIDKKAKQIKNEHPMQLDLFGGNEEQPSTAATEQPKASDLVSKDVVKDGREYLLGKYPATLDIMQEEEFKVFFAHQLNLGKVTEIDHGNGWISKESRHKSRKAVRDKIEERGYGLGNQLVSDGSSRELTYYDAKNDVIYSIIYEGSSTKGGDDFINLRVDTRASHAYSEESQKDAVEHTNTEAENGEKAVNLQGTNNTDNEEGINLQSGSAEAGSGRQQSQQDGTLGGSTGNAVEPVVNGRVDGRDGTHTSNDKNGNRGLGSTDESKTNVAPRNTRNNHAERGKDYAPKSPDARLKANIDAITVMRKCLEEGREATAEEMNVLRQFSGWGGLGKLIDDSRLEDIMDASEIEQAQLSANSSFYTPAYVIDSMWDIANALGFTGGNVLEGSAGIGNIIGAMPTSMSASSYISAVEIDGITGNILKLLYPDANVQIQGFEATKIPNGSVDLAITNVPFVTGLHVRDTQGDKDLSDKFKNIHDFCIAKNVRKLRPGGIGIFISSSGTLDNSKALRDWVTTQGGADFVGAFRLNNKTFGGTGATSDIIIIRKRTDGKISAAAEDFSTITVNRVLDYDTGEVKKKNGEIVPVIKKVSVSYNGYFAEHPEFMGGNMEAGFEEGDTFRPLSLALYPNGVNQKDRLDLFVETMKEKGKQFEKSGEEARPQQTNVNEALGKDVKEGSLIVNGNGDICVARFGTAVPLEGKSIGNKVKGRTKQECLKMYKNIMTALNNLLEYEASTESDAELPKFLKALNKAYDDFVKAFGNLNKNTSISFLKNDVDFYGIAALEKVTESGDKSGKRIVTVKKTDVFSKRVVSKAKDPSPKTIADAVTASIFNNGYINIPYIAEKLGIIEEEARTKVIEDGHAFENPVTGNIEVDYEYLSGNVREKLEVAKNNNEDGKYDINIKSLEKVVPMTIPSHLIEFNIGSSWIPKKYFEEYAAEKIGRECSFVFQGGMWALDHPVQGGEKNMAFGVTSKLCDKIIYGSELIEAAMKNTTIAVQKVERDYDGNTRTIKDKDATALCNNRIIEIREDFKEWMRAKMQNDAELAASIEKIYNDKFNNFAPKNIPDTYVRQHLDGANNDITLYPHQSKAVTRAVAEPVLLAHEVGTGKTFTLISTAMEMRRLGTAKKPMIVVQNATVGQFVKDAKLLYPNAKVLTIEDKDKTAAGRVSFYAKIKYNDWDIIVVPQSVFDRIPDAPERQAAFIQEKIEEKMALLADTKDGVLKRNLQSELDELNEELSVVNVKTSVKDSKRKAKAKENANVKAQEMLDRAVDDVEDFDDMGIDALLIDEAHEYKHLGFTTAMQRGVKGVDPSYSKKAQGLLLKTRAVKEKNNGRNVVFATGTPISNTAAEVWTFMRYLMPRDVMEGYGIYYFDDFTRNFGNIMMMLEFTTSGSFKENNRFAGYVNLPELNRIWSSVTDTVLTEDAGKVSEKIPVLEGGKPQDIFLPQSHSLRSIMKSVRTMLEEFEKMDGKEKRANSYIPLVAYGMAAKAAVDPRLVWDSAPDEPMSKTNRAVEEILADLDKTKEYNGTVALFCDAYQNKRTGFNIYDDIKSKLVSRGIPDEQIFVMKSGMSVKKKQEVFDKVNSGEIRVIMGSTQTLGTGVNIQERLHMLIHMDVPNRPMDYTQRNGRELRQGNLHKEWGKSVRIVRFGVEDSLDVTGYQRLKTKGAIADSVMNGRKTLESNQENRTIEEEDENNFADMTAQLSGSQYAMLKNSAERELKKLENKKKQFESDQVYVANAIRRHTRSIEWAESNIADAKNQIAKVRELAPAGTPIDYNGYEFASVDKMDEVFKGINKDMYEKQERVRKNAETRGYTHDTSKYVIKIGGLNFVIDIDIVGDTKYDNTAHKLVSVVNKKFNIKCKELDIDEVAKGGYVKDVVNYIVNDIVSGKRSEETIKNEEERIETLKSELEVVKKREGQTFQDNDKLEEARRKVDEYKELMRAEMEEKEAKYKELDEKVEDIDLGTAVAGERDDAMDYEEKEEDVRDRAGNGAYEHTAEELVRMYDAVLDATEKLGVPVRVVRSLDEIDEIDGLSDAVKERVKKNKGAYNASTGEVIVVLHNNMNVTDAVKTVLHEIVGHKGLRMLVGEEAFNEFLDNTFMSLPDRVRSQVVKDAATKYGGNIRVATEEWLAERAEKYDTPSVWNKIVAAVRQMFRKIGIRVELNDNDVKYLLWQSKHNLESKNPIERAKSIRMRERLGIGADMRYRTSEELDAEYPNWNDTQTTSKGGHSTQISGTTSTYKKIGEWIKKAGLEGARILDASSGKGLGTQALREMGLEVDDVEPFAPKDREAPTYTSYDDIENDYDVIISNAVLNVIPDDWRADVLRQMAKHLAVGGKMIINTRGVSEAKGVKNKVELDDASEILISNGKGGYRSYQKFFTHESLTKFIKDTLGESYSVEKATIANSGIKNEQAVVVTKQDGGGDKGRASKISESIINKFNVTGKDAQAVKDIVDSIYEGIDKTVGLFRHFHYVAMSKAFEAKYGVPSKVVNMFTTEKDLLDYGFTPDEARRILYNYKYGNAYAECFDDSRNIVVYEKGFAPLYAVEFNMFHECMHRYLRGMDANDRNEFLHRFYLALKDTQDRLVNLLPAMYPNNSDMDNEEEFFCYIMQHDLFAGNFKLTDHVEEFDKETINDILKSLNYDRTREERARSNRRRNGRNDNAHKQRENVRLRTGEEDEGDSQTRGRESKEIGSVIDTTDNGVQIVAKESGAARDMYERTLRTAMYKISETWQDSMRGLKEAMRSVMKASGKTLADVADWENPYMAENHMSSVNEQEFKAYRDQYFKPVLEAVSNLMKRGASRDDINKYLFCKHGMERNRAFARRDAESNAPAHISETREEVFKLLEAARKEDNPLLVLRYEALLNGSEESEKVLLDWTISALEDMYLHKTDYAGFTALFEADELEEYKQQLLESAKDGAEADKIEAMTKQDLRMGLAQQRVNEFEDKYNQGKGAAEDYLTSNLWSAINAATQATLEKQLASGIINAATYQELTERFAYYIPLRGFDETTSDEVYDYLRVSGSPMNSPVKKANGRKSLADDPIATIGNMAESSIMEGNRNLMKQKLLNFVENHPSDLFAVSDVCLHKVETEDGDVWEAVGADYSDCKTPADVDTKRIVFEAWFAQKMQEEPDSYTTQRQRPDIPYRTLKTFLGEHRVMVYRGGKAYVITVNGNPRAAQAVNGHTNPDSSGDMAKVAGSITNFMARNCTTWSLPFILSNLSRDGFYTNSMVWVKESPAYARKYNLNWAKAMINLVPILIKEDLNSINPEEKTMHRYYMEFVRGGGETGQTRLTNVEEYKNVMADEIKKLNGKNVSLATIREVVMHALDQFNRWAECTSRFAAYITSRQMGRSMTRSINDAKEISVNFNKKGSYGVTKGKWEEGNRSNYVMGMTAQVMRPAFMFLNAGVQGMYNTGKAAANNKWKFFNLALTYFSAGAFMPLVAAALGCVGGGDDDDYWNLPEYVRRNNLCICLGKGNGYVTLPLPIELRAIYGMADIMMEGIFGNSHKSKSTIAMEIVEQMSQVFPIDFAGEGGMGFVPSPVKPIAEVWNNTTWTGLPIYKDYDYLKNAPAFTKVYGRTNKDLVNVCAAVNEFTGGNEHKRGGIDLNPAIIQHILEGYLGGLGTTITDAYQTASTIGSDDFEWSRIPVVSRFYKHSDERMPQKKIDSEYYDFNDIYGDRGTVQSEYTGFKKDLEDADPMKRAKAMTELKRIENSDEFAKRQIWNEYDKVLKELKDARNATGDKSLDDEIYKVKAELNAIMREPLKK